MEIKKAGMRVLAALKESDKLLGALQGHYAMRNEFGVLFWHDIETGYEIRPVAIADIGRDEWSPYHEKKEIRPEIAGELWKNKDGNIIFTHESGNEGRITITEMNGYMSGKYGTIIHNQAGWKLIFSPDEEVMSRIKEVEDDSVERKVEGCPVCGSGMAYIRGRSPGEDNRKVCPTCLQERMEEVNNISSRDYNVAYEDSP